MNERAWPLPPRAARVYYNVADAWLGASAAGVDRVAALALDERARRRLARRLALLEWSPRLLLHSRRGFSWLPREARRAWLERLSTRGPRLVRAAVADLERLVRTPIEAQRSFPP